MVKILKEVTKDSAIKFDSDKYHKNASLYIRFLSYVTFTLNIFYLLGFLKITNIVIYYAF